MRIYLAGGDSYKKMLFGHLDNETMKLFLVTTSGQYSKYIVPRIQENGEKMRLYLAGGECRADILGKQRYFYKPYILESFYNINDNSEKYLPCYGDYMLDSGAFSMFSSGKPANLDNYIERYIAYINKHKIEKYFELDIDRQLGYEKVLAIRNYLYQKTAIPPIPVWHKSRGIENFKQMCQTYKYVAIGGYVSKEFSKDELASFPVLIRYAHKCGAKIHGLGFTDMKLIRTCHFDSVDSTSWVAGNRFGMVYKFDGRTMKQFKKPPGTRVINKKTAINNFVEWIKFQRYAEVHL